MREIFEQLNAWAALDITLMTIAIYYILILVKGTRTAQTLTGVLIIFVAFFASSTLPLTTVNWVFNKFYSSIILIIIIIFQDDIRHALSKIGRKSLIASHESIASNHILDELTKTAASLTKKRIGALMVLERNILLGRYVDIGTLLDARISREVLMAIFHPTSPIHDGAVIIQRGRIAAAGCFLPLTREENLTKHWGTRHRAAIGISQETDALVILISEETGRISLVMEGLVNPVEDPDELRRLLQRFLIDEPKFIHAQASGPQAGPLARLRGRSGQAGESGRGRTS